MKHNLYKDMKIVAVVAAAVLLALAPMTVLADYTDDSKQAETAVSDENANIEINEDADGSAGETVDTNEIEEAKTKDVEFTSIDDISIATPTEAKRADSESDAETDEELTAEIIGRWDADDSIGLKFGEKGKGKLILSKKDYSFTYKVKNDQLSLDFTSSKVMDCSYTISITADKLTIIGSEGTTGETFELTRH